MRLLITSPAFVPQVGGLEIHAAQIAESIARRGHEVVVATTTPSGNLPLPDRLPYRVVRRPGPRELLAWTRWCEVFFQINVSLRMLWPLLLVRRPWVVSHHSWYRQADGRIAWQDRVKRHLLRHATSIAVSRALADDLAVPSLVIPNPYRDDLFRLLPEVPRTRDLAYLGRLVSDKGVDLLLEALARLAARGLYPGLTVIGDGPEGPALREQARRLGLDRQVDFLGTRTGEELVRLLNEHRILVVPSRYDEPFGTVALEGSACGCVPVGSAGGGLADAIGPCGVTFPNGDVEALADTLASLLAPGAQDRLRAAAPGHLARHAGARIVADYLQVLETIRQDGGVVRPAGRGAEARP